MTEHTPTPWMTHRAGELLPDDWMIMADMGLTPNGIQQVSTVARALSIRQTPETTAANAAFIVKACNSHDALVGALRELYAQVKGECPSLLNEDSGGDGRLDLEIQELLASVEGSGKP
jgi:hypothetical protein